jgi:transposase-like protein
MHTMPPGKLRPTLEEVKALLAANRDLLRPLVQAVVQELLEAEMTGALGVEMHGNWLEAHRYLNMDDLREHKEALRMAA